MPGPCVVIALDSRFMGKVVFFGPQKGRHLRGCPEVAMAVSWQGDSCGTAGWCSLGQLWISLGFRYLASRELYGDAAENRDLVLWSRIQGNECVVKKSLDSQVVKSVFILGLGAMGQPRQEKHASWAKNVLPLAFQVTETIPDFRSSIVH